MAELPRTVTPLPARTAAALMMTALSIREPEETRARVAQHLLSLVWIETGNGKKCIQHNWGNLSGESPLGKFWRPPWYKVTAKSSARNKMLHKRMLAGKAPSQFRAYESRGAGLEDFLNLVYRPAYKPMLEAARHNDPSAFASAVHDTGYCADDECRGPRTVARYDDLTSRFAKLLGIPEGERRAAPVLNLAALGLLVVLLVVAERGRGRR